jgi:hypothetical protein
MFTFSRKFWVISIARLWCYHLYICDLSTSSSITSLRWSLILRWVSYLDAFSTYLIRTWLPCDAAGATTGTPEVRPTRSSRTRVRSSQASTPTTDRDRTVSRRSEPSSRATLIGEQPNPWDLLQPQDVTSRHRGAKPLRRYELLGVISLLSPEYLLSFERWPFHTEPPDHYILVSYLLDLFVSQSSTLLLLHSTHGYQACWGYLWKPPLRFWRRPPQSNYPPNMVLAHSELDFK